MFSQNIVGEAPAVFHSQLSQVIDTALKLENDILALKPPERRPLKGVRRIFYTSHNTPGPKKKSKAREKSQFSGSGAGMIAGKISAHLDPNNEQDLCVLAPTVQKDRQTRLFEGRLSYFFRVGSPSSFRCIYTTNKLTGFVGTNRRWSV